MVKEYRNCDEVREDFSALLDEELSPEEQSAIEAHLATCAECLRALNALKTVDNLFADLPPTQAPLGFEDRVMRDASKAPGSGTAPRQRWSRGLRWTAFAAAAALLLTAGVVVIRAPRQDDSFTVANLSDERANTSRISTESAPAAESAAALDSRAQQTPSAPPPQPLADDEAGAAARFRNAENEAAPTATAGAREPEPVRQPERRMEIAQSDEFDANRQTVSEDAVEAKPEAVSPTTEPTTTFFQNQGARIRVSRDAREGVETPAESFGGELDLTDTLGATTESLRKSDPSDTATIDGGGIGGIRLGEQAAQVPSADEAVAAPRVSERLVLEDGVWSDPAYDGQETIALSRDSDVARNLIVEHPEVADFLNLSEAVVFRVDKTWYRLSATE